MNHIRNAIRLGIVIFWLTFAGLIFSAAINASGAAVLGWPSWIFYGAAALVAVYAGFFATRKLWNIK